MKSLQTWRNTNIYWLSPSTISLLLSQTLAQQLQLTARLATKQTIAAPQSTTHMTTLESPQFNTEIPLLALASTVENSAPAHHGLLSGNSSPFISLILLRRASSLAWSIAEVAEDLV